MLEAFLSGLLMAVLGFALSSVPFSEQPLTFSQPLLITSAECLLQFRSLVDPVPLAQNLKYLGIFARHAETQRTVRQVNFADHPPSQIERGNISERYQVAVKLSPDCSESRTALKSQQSSVTEQHTLGHMNCAACEVQRTAVIVGSSELAFDNAAQIWLQQHQLYISARTLRDYKQYLKPLCSFLGPAKLENIHIGTVRSYQAWRMQKASNHLVNSEIRSVLKPVMREAGLWEPIAALYKALPVDRSGAGKSYTEAQKQKMLAAAFSRKRWLLAGHCLNVMLNTGCGFGELRQVRRSEFEGETLLIADGAKNEERYRVVPLNRAALDSMRWLVQRWERIGGTAPDQFILAKRAPKLGDPPDFYSPMSSIKTAFYQIREAAGLPAQPWKGMRIYDCRVTAITESLSSGTVSLHTAQKLYGHVSEQMQRRYYKPQLELLREAVTRLEKKPPTKQRLQQTAALWISSTTY